MTEGRHHLALIGLMGAGKTAVGAVVARRLGWPLVDVDDEIVERTGATTRELWERGGEAAYRPLEREITLEALERPAPSVIGVPAGVAMDPTGQAVLDRAALAVVWLRADLTTLAARIAQQDHRPLVDDDPVGLLRRQTAERSATYERLADLVLDVDGRTPDQLAVPIVALVETRTDPGGSWVAPPDGPG